MSPMSMNVSLDGKNKIPCFRKRTNPSVTFKWHAMGCDWQQIDKQTNTHTHTHTHTHKHTHTPRRHHVSQGHVPPTIQTTYIRTGSHDQLTIRWRLLRYPHTNAHVSNAHCRRLNGHTYVNYTWHTSTRALHAQTRLGWLVGCSFTLSVAMICVTEGLLVGPGQQHSAQCQDTKETNI